MADAVSLAASIIAVVQLSAQLTCMGYGYLASVKKAPQEIRQLVAELVSLNSVLNAVQDRVDEGQHVTTLQKLYEPGGPIRVCEEELNTLMTELGCGHKDNSSSKRALERITWHFKEARLQKQIERIRRQKELIELALNTDHFSLSKSTHTLLQHTDGKVEKLVDEEKVRKRLEVLNWLYPGDYQSRHADIQTRRKEGTGEWLFETPEFREWSIGKMKPGLLWGKGIPGAGKTFMSSIVIDHLKNLAVASPKRGFAYIYFDYKKGEEQVSITVLSCILRQLAGQCNQLPGRLKMLFDNRQCGNQKPSLQQLYNALLEVLDSFDSVYVVCDALDECDLYNRQGLLELFAKMEKSGMNLFVTSRPHPDDIQYSFQDMTRIDLSAREQDLRLYIQSEITRSPKAKRYVQSSDLEEEIISALVNCAQGMFLLVRFHIQQICKQNTAARMRRELEAIRNSSTAKYPLDSTYDRVIELINKQDEDGLCWKVISWISNAQRPLSIEELRIAVSIEEGRYELDRTDLPDQETLTDVCAGFVVIEEMTKTVRFAHYTVYEYLQRRAILPETALATIANACTTYLAFDIFGKVRDDSIIDWGGGQLFAPNLKYHFPERNQMQKISALLPLNIYEYTLRDYMTQYLQFHLKACDKRLTEASFLGFLNKEKNLSSYLRNMYPYIESTLAFCWHTYGKLIPLLCVASSVGHTAAVQLLVLRGADVNASDEVGHTALWLAIENGHIETAQYLMDQGVNINETGYDRISKYPPQWAVAKGDTDMILYSKVSRVEPFFYSTDIDHTQLIKRLKTIKENGQDINAENYLASRLYGMGHGHPEKVRLAHIRGVSYLRLAASCGYVELVRLLLERGTGFSIDATSYDGETTLHNAIRYRCDYNVVRFLVEQGANITAADKFGITALLYAARANNVDVVRFLVEKGADIDATDDKGMTALLLAAEIVVPELEMPRIVDHAGRMAIFHATSSKWKYYHRFPAKMSIQERDELHAWKRNKHEIVRFLIEKGSDVNAAGYERRTTLLSIVTFYDDIDLEIVRFLVGKGADVNARDSLDRTPLYWAILHNNPHLKLFLKERGGRM